MKIDNKPFHNPLFPSNTFVCTRTLSLYPHFLFILHSISLSCSSPTAGPEPQLYNVNYSPGDGAVGCPEEYDEVRRSLRLVLASVHVGATGQWLNSPCTLAQPTVIGRSARRPIITPMWMSLRLNTHGLADTEGHLAVCTSVFFGKYWIELECARGFLTCVFALVVSISGMLVSSCARNLYISPHCCLLLWM